jgi:hypothetical protein
MLRILAAVLSACVLGAPLAARAQCPPPYARVVADALATRDSLDAIERYAPADGPARATSSLVVRARSMSRSLDDAVLYAERGDPRRASYMGDDLHLYLSRLRGDLDAVMPSVRVSAQLPPETRAELYRIALAISLTGGCR